MGKKIQRDPQSVALAQTIKVTKRGSFPNENALFKLLYLRVTELYKKWKNRPVGNWAMVRNQLSINPEIQSRVALYEHL